MTDPFDAWLYEEDRMCEDADLNAPHGENTDDEMDVDADDNPDT